MRDWLLPRDARDRMIVALDLLPNDGEQGERAEGFHGGRMAIVRRRAGNVWRVKRL